MARLKSCPAGSAGTPLRFLWCGRQVRNLGWNWLWNYWNYHRLHDLRHYDRLDHRNWNQHFLLPIGNRNSALPEAGDKQKQQGQLADDPCSGNARRGNETHPAPEAANENNRGTESSDQITAQQTAQAAKGVAEACGDRFSHRTLIVQDRIGLRQIDPDAT